MIGGREVVVDEEEGGLYNRSIDIKRCWVKYGLALLELSWMRLCSEEMQQALGKCVQTSSSYC